ncbi:MAG TPA: T6SS immunity protein Tdi1 domain-containing protein [Povalibacter sp.]
MNLNDYLIAPGGNDWKRLLGYWRPPLPEDFTLWLVNRFGDAFGVVQDGSVHRLRVSHGTVEQLARSREHFAQLLDTGDNASRWLLLPLVDACGRAGMNLKPGQCYGLKIPPLLGGRFELANIEPARLLTYYSYQAYIHKQTEIYWVPPE